MDHKEEATKQIDYLRQQGRIADDGDIAIAHALLAIAEQIERLADYEQMKDPDYQEWLAHQDIED